MNAPNPTDDCFADQTRIDAEIAAQIAAVLDVEARCKASFLPLLRAHGITRVEILYDGSGDEGGVGDVIAFADDAVVEVPAILCEHHGLEFHGAVKTRAIDLEDALSAFADNAVSAHHSDWEDGEGAHGTLLINVATGAVTLTHNARVIDYNTVQTEL